MADQQIAVLIDYENVGLSSIQWLFDQISDIGRVIVKRAYADWSIATTKRDQEKLLELGIEPVHLFHSPGSGKNSSDIRLVTEAVDLLYQSPVGTFVIVSADSDFVPLVSKLRSAGKTVIGAGREAAVSRMLVTSCDRYFYLDQNKAPATVPSKSGPSSQQTTGSLLARAVRATMDEQGRALGSKLRQTIQRLDPAFDFPALGYPTFSKFLEASPEVKVTRPKGPGDIIVELLDQSTPDFAAQAGFDGWAVAIHAAWSKRADTGNKFISGPAAAASAATVLGVAKLTASRFKTLQRLLDSSELLRKHWSRDGNRVVRRAD